jgi:RNA polymerase sigma-70 factor, ECF subfamily
MTLSPQAHTSAFEAHRCRLTGLAYRMLGSLSEAEDVVQEAWLRWQTNDRENVEHPNAFLQRIVTRLCLDHVKSARAQREVYFGQWLPEPIAEASLEFASSPDAAHELADDISFAFLLALERLSPLERAAFLLHDVFDVSFDEIAVTLERTSEACRTLASRARQRVRSERSDSAPSPSDVARLFTAFHQAVQTGDLATFARMLAQDAVLISDGGGKKSAALNPIHGRDRILRFFVGIAAKSGPVGPEQIEGVVLNGQHGLRIAEPDGGIQTWCLDWHKDGHIVAIYLQRNPDKLTHAYHIIPSG